MSEYQLVAQAGSFDELNDILASDNRRLNSGDKVLFTLELNGPEAYLFNLPGAELLFRNRMPPGLVLDDVRAAGWSTVEIHAHATSPWFAAIGAWLVSEWWIIPLISLGIALVLGAIITSIGFSVAAVSAPTIIPQTAMWVALGIAGVAVVGAIAYGAKQKGYT